MESRLNHRIAPPVLLLAMSGVALLAISASAFAQGQGSFAGTETCLECHSEIDEAMGRTVHGNLQPDQYPGAGVGCEACHGPGTAHAVSEDPADILLPTADGEGAGECLACHRTGHTMDWETSSHARNDVACLSCHRIHQASFGKALLKAPEAELCGSCHMDVRAKFQLPSHHPLREGFMSCVSCHDVHSGDMQAPVRSFNRTTRPTPSPTTRRRATCSSSTPT